MAVGGKEHTFALSGGVGKVRLMFQDEAGFGRINRPKYCWCRKGTRPSVPCHHIREYLDSAHGDMHLHACHHLVAHRHGRITVEGIARGAGGGIDLLRHDQSSGRREAGGTRR